MKSFKIQLSDAAEPTVLDAAQLVEGRALIQGTSGSGKSYLARVIAEQTIPKGLQTIILDPEGEFVTLREKCRILIAGKGGDVPAETRSAKLLAQRISETAVSAVVDLSELKLDDRREFVRIFLTALDRVRKRSPRLVILDESHKFAPEAGKGKSIATDAVVTLMSQGRKRGLCGILLTQRLSKLSKDAAAEANNILIGRTSPVDLARAQDLLGVTREDKERLRTMKPGWFIASGPAVNHPEPLVVPIQRSQTGHPKAGSRYTAAPPPPQRAIKRLLKEFESLPPSAEEEAAESLEAAQVRIGALERELKTAKSRAEKADQADTQRWKNAGRVQRLEKQVEELEAELTRREEEFLAELTRREGSLRALHGRLHEAKKSFEEQWEAYRKARTIGLRREEEVVEELRGILDQLAAQERTSRERDTAALAAGIQLQTDLTREATEEAARRSNGRAEPLQPAERGVLDALAWWEATGVDAPSRVQVAFVCGCHPRSKAHTNRISRLKTAGYIDVIPGGLTLAPRGRVCAESPEAPGTSADLQAMILERLQPAERTMLQVVLDAYPRWVDADALAKACGVHPRSKAHTNRRSKLKGLSLLVQERARGVRAADVLFV